MLVLYTYVGYPLWLFMLQRIFVKPLQKGVYLPTVSVVIAARNEEKNILRRLKNLLEQDYPSDKLDIVVVSDGSTDRTVELLSQQQCRQLSVINLSSNQGKAAALNAGVAASQGEIIVFTDARQQFETRVIKQLVSNFVDSKIGCVSGELIFLKDENNTIQTEIGAYWKYEKWIRKAESVTGSVVGATGAIYAIRQNLFQSLPQGTLLDDVLTPMRIVMQGYRTVFDGSAIAYDVVSKDTSQEWKRKVRTLAGNWQLLSLQPALLVPFVNPNWFRFVSHKLLRLIVPFALLVLLFSSFFLSGPFYLGMSLLQLFCYLCAAIGLSAPVARRFRLISLSYFFVIMNAAAAVGFWYWMTGQASTVWQPAYTKVKTV